MLEVIALPGDELTIMHVFWVNKIFLNMIVSVGTQTSQEC